MSDTKVSLKAFPTPAGYDSFAAERKVIVPHGKELIKLTFVSKFQRVIMRELLERLVWQILKEYLGLMVPPIQNIEETFVLSCLI